VHGMRGTDPELHNNLTSVQPATNLSTQDRTAPNCLDTAGDPIKYMDRYDPGVLFGLQISVLRRQLAVPLPDNRALRRLVLSAHLDVAVRLHQHHCI